MFPLLSYSRQKTFHTITSSRATILMMLFWYLFLELFLTGSIKGIHFSSVSSLEISELCNDRIAPSKPVTESKILSLHRKIQVGVNPYSEETRIQRKPVFRGKPYLEKTRILAYFTQLSHFSLTGHPRFEKTLSKSLA